MNGPNRKRRDGMDYIPDKTTYAAVMFARMMIREGEDASVAIIRAANYYGVPPNEVGHFVGQVLGKKFVFFGGSEKPSAPGRRPPRGPFSL